MEDLLGEPVVVRGQYRLRLIAAEVIEPRGRGGRDRAGVGDLDEEPPGAARQRRDAGPVDPDQVDDPRVQSFARDQRTSAPASADSPDALPAAPQPPLSQ